LNRKRKKLEKKKKNLKKEKNLRLEKVELVENWWKKRKS